LHPHSQVDKFLSHDLSHNPCIPAVTENPIDTVTENSILANVVPLCQITTFDLNEKFLDVSATSIIHFPVRLCMRLCRREALLEASKNWISRETLLDSINLALDNPKPFGFTRTIPKWEDL